ncbi:unnamed protein product [Moneuplotes crassus]|uniref:Uncharacterized protein n=1 Tax=Euplotes crassus TaxID=5936 RepID=A0AAD1X8S0_EUPCR|nr:unnamed protein product [Moneuplotes crassus]
MSEDLGLYSSTLCSGSSSGAINPCVPLRLVTIPFLELIIWLTPKSEIFTLKWRSNKMLCGLISQCAISKLCI